METFSRCLLALCISLFVAVPNTVAAPVFIELTTDALGLGSADINYAGNDSPVEPDPDIVGKLITSTAPNVGTTLFIQEDNLAGQSDLLVTVTARSHLDIQDNLPVGYDIHAGVITLTNKEGDLSTEGLGVRAFGLDTDITSPTYGKRWINGDGKYVMEGSKEVSGGGSFTDWLDYVADNPIPPHNNPPHVDEDVLFDFDSGVSVRGDSVKVVLTKIKGVLDNDPLNLGLDLTVNLVGGGQVYQSFCDISDDTSGGFSILSGYDDVLEVDLGLILGLGPGDIVDSFIIGARDDCADPLKETDEHFLINGFHYEEIPEPMTFVILGLGALFLRRRKV